MQCSQTEAEQILRVLGREIWPKVEQGLTQLTAAFGADPQYRRIPITAGLYRTVPEPHLNEHRYKFRTLPRNTPIQGLAGHVFRWACVYADRCMSDMGGDLLLPLHDSLIAEVPADRCEEGVTQLSVAMTQAARDVLGFDLDCKAESRGAVAWAKGGDVTTLARFLSDQG
jgi:hypothetical protein